MEALHPSHALDDVAVLDAALQDDDWPVIQKLWRSGVTNESIYRLLRLRLTHRRQGAPTMDGFVEDPRAHFARWLVQTGRLNESA
ncbi:MAG: hypothetical protein ACRDI2_13670 [Chloroflexota bacterium]